MSRLDSSAFDPVLALFLARCSQAAYADQKQSSAQALGLSVASFSCGPIGGFVGEDADRRVLAFEGTHDLAGWLDDANCGLVGRPEYPGRVHCGFSRGLQSVWDQVEPLTVGTDMRPFYVTGHSLGGALASLAQWRLAAAGLNVSACHTFGEPRVGDAAWAAGNALPHWRVVHDCDPVARVPFPPLYRHIGRMAWFDRFDRLNPDPTLWRRTVNWIEEEIDRSEGPWQLRVAQLAEEHTIESYVAALEKTVT
jgi:hypothetical protein